MSKASTPFDIHYDRKEDLDWRLDIPHQKGSDTRTIAVSGFSGETIHGKDQLNITPDVNAFAALISSRDLKPPLSIGLFGDWGSGKSFFMSKLKEAVAANVNLVKDKQERILGDFLTKLDEAAKDEGGLEELIGDYLPSNDTQVEQIQQWLTLPDIWAREVLLKIYGNNSKRVDWQIQLMREDPAAAVKKLRQEVQDWRIDQLPEFVTEWQQVIGTRKELAEAVRNKINPPDSEPGKTKAEAPSLHSIAAIEAVEQELIDARDRTLSELFAGYDPAEKIDEKVAAAIHILEKVDPTQGEKEKYLDWIIEHTQEAMDLLDTELPLRSEGKRSQLGTTDQGLGVFERIIFPVREQLKRADAEQEIAEERALTERIDAHTDATMLRIREQQYEELSVATDRLLNDLKKQKDFLAVLKKLTDIQQEQQDVEGRQFCRYISQIEFNAWHFVDTNLWASLINHIFEALNRYVGNLTISEREYIQLYRTLENTQEMVQRKETELHRAELAIRKTNGELWDSRIRSKNERKDLSTVRLADAWKLFQKHHPEADDISQKIKDLIEKAKGELSEEQAAELEEIKRLNLDSMDTLVRLEAAIKAFTSPGGKVFKAFKAAESMSPKELFFLVLFVLLLFVTFYLIPYFEDGKPEWLVALLSQFAAVGGIVLKVVPDFISRMRGGLEKVEKGISILEQAQATLHQLRDSATAHKEQEIAALEARLQEEENIRAQLEREKAELEKQKSELEFEKEEIEKGHRFSSFIEDRLNSADYKKHLGLISIIRNDFEKLTNYLHHRGQYSRLVTQFERPEVEQVDTIDRIILYIDDLDRCPPEKVVEVLQAIHLILAFPLFVVVVGVDVRWVSKSLIKKYGTMLAPVAPGNGLAGEFNYYGSLGEGAELSLQYKNNATPFDYLEKIFQIPFRLQVMDEQAKKNYLGKLLENDLSKQEKKAADSSASTAGESKEKAREEKEIANSETGKDRSERKASTETSTSESHSKDDEAAPGKATELTTELRPIRLAQEEYDFIRFLSPLLVGSPRTIKRFANICRLIKSHEKWGEGKPIPESDLSEYLTLIFVLSVITGKPRIASRFFDWLQDEVMAGNGEQSLWAFIEDLQEGKKAILTGKEHKWAGRFAHFDEASNEEWREIYSFLETGRGPNDLPEESEAAADQRDRFLKIRNTALRRIDDLTSIAGRFSFRFTRY